MGTAVGDKALLSVKSCCLSQRSLHLPPTAWAEVVHEPSFKFPLYKTLHQLQLVKSIWIYAAVSRLLLSLLKQCSNTSNTITVIILTLVVREALSSVRLFTGVASLSQEDEPPTTFSFFKRLGNSINDLLNLKDKASDQQINHIHIIT